MAFLTKVTRTYSKSINLKTYGFPDDSWVKLESSYEAQVESNDDPVATSKMLEEMAAKDVVGQVNEIIKKVTDRYATKPATAPAPTAPSSAMPNISAPLPNGPVGQTVQPRAL